MSIFFFFCYYHVFSTMHIVLNRICVSFFASSIFFPCKFLLFVQIHCYREENKSFNTQREYYHYEQIYFNAFFARWDRSWTMNWIWFFSLLPCLILLFGCKLWIVCYRKEHFINRKIRFIIIFHLSILSFRFIFFLVFYELEKLYFQ